MYEKCPICNKENKIYDSELKYKCWNCGHKVYQDYVYY